MATYEDVEVKSGDKVVANIKIEKFDTISEAVKFYNDKFANTEDAGKGEETVLALINAQHKAKTANAKRVEMTKEVSPLTTLKARIKSDPNAKKRLEELLAEFGIEGTLNVPSA